MDPQEAVIFLLSKVRGNVISSKFEGFVLNKPPDAMLYMKVGHIILLDCYVILQPETILSHMKFLLSHLTSLNEESLVHIARVLDPSRPSFRSLASKVRPPRQR